MRAPPGAHRGQVPTFKDGDVVVNESLAAIIYLEVGLMQAAASRCLDRAAYLCDGLAVGVHDRCMVDLLAAPCLQETYANQGTPLLPPLDKPDARALVSRDSGWYQLHALPGTDHNVPWREAFQVLLHIARAHLHHSHCRRCGSAWQRAVRWQTSVPRHSGCR
jgi:hypothetical protein